MSATIQLAIIFTPDEGGMPLILQRVANRMLLVNAIRDAISETERQMEADPVSRAAREGQLRVLRLLLDGGFNSQPTVM